MSKVTLKIMFQARIETQSSCIPTKYYFPSTDLVAIVLRDQSLRLVLREFNIYLRTAKMLGHCDT